MVQAYAGLNDNRGDNLWSKKGVTLREREKLQMAATRETEGVK